MIQSPYLQHSDPRTSLPTALAIDTDIDIDSDPDTGRYAMAGYDNTGSLIMTSAAAARHGQNNILRLSAGSGIGEPSNSRTGMEMLDVFGADLGFEGDGLLYVSQPSVFQEPHFPTCL